MAELNLKQITDKLNNEFTGETRKLVFWYDDKAEFAEDIDTLELVNAEVYHLEPDNQFYTKYFLERQDRTTNYLIYAPFPKPPVRDNHLEDTLLYSKRFFADRASLLTVDLGINAKYKPVIQKYIKFFRAKDRTQRFYNLEIENFTRETIEVALMSALCKTRIASFEEVVRVILTDGELEDNKFLNEFDKYDLLPAFWRLCEQQFGYNDMKPTLEKLVITLFITYTERSICGEVPEAWKSFVSYKSGSIIAFLDNLMNNVLYRERFNELSAYAAVRLNAFAALETYKPEALLNCDTFAAVDRFFIGWVRERLMAEDTGAKLEGMTIPEVCQKRGKMHFGKDYQEQYQLLENAFYLIQAVNYNCPDDFKEIVDQYRSSDYLIDTAYRNFYYWFDQLTDNVAFEHLHDLVENIYTNEYLSKLISKWNTGFISEEAMVVLPLQRNFYSRYICSCKERVVVIISDAMRYETGRSLWAKLQDDAKCSAKLEAMLSVLPSYTRLGMAALLPHKSLEMTTDFRVLTDGAVCEDLKQREVILQSYNS
ncbi:MAG: BREX-1 system phosphatase PglZ type A, partial [Syntrophomonadaceae bacterium]|nr:BREX-1 system phosphatase PglZ type A [Syntrophomonadaceae bacterium]